MFAFKEVRIALEIQPHELVFKVIDLAYVHISFYYQTFVGIYLLLRV